MTTAMEVYSALNTATLPVVLVDALNKICYFSESVTSSSVHAVTDPLGWTSITIAVIDSSSSDPYPQYHNNARHDLLTRHTLGTVVPQDSSKADLASPALTGIPTAPTATSGTNTTQVATCEFVQGAVSDVAGVVLPVDDTTSIVQDPTDNTKQVRIDAGAITTGTVRVITVPDADVDLTSGTSANQLLRLDSSAKLPAVDGSNLTGVSGSGDVSGPSSSVDNEIPRYDLTTGKVLQNSLVTIDDDGSINIPSGQSYKINGTAISEGTKVLVSSNDSTSGYLNGKLVAGTNITLTEGSDGGNETLTISVSGAASGIGWTSETNFTATPASTSTLTMTSDRTGVIKPGMALQYTISSTIYYGVVTAITSTLLTVAGAPLSGDVSNLYYSTNPAQVVQVDFSIPTEFADASNTALLSSDGKTKFRWNLQEARLVRFSHIVGTADTGASQPRVNITNGGNAISSSNTNAGTEVSTSWVNTVVDINISNYSVSYGNTIEISTDANGTNDDAENLTVSCIFVVI